MRINWTNIFVIALLICLVTVLAKLPDILDRLSGNIQLPEYLNDPVYGVMFLGLICVTIIAIVKIICDR